MNRRPRDAKATRQQILDCAEKLFIKQGFSGTSLSQISKAAQAHKSLILHHFETKAGLWQAVKHRCLEGFTEKQQQIFQQGEVSLEEFKQTIRAYFKLLQRNPAIVKLLSWTELERDTQATQFDKDKLNTFHQRLTQAQEKGLLRRDVNTAHLLLLLINGITQWFEAKHMFEAWESLDQAGDQDEAFLDSLVDIVMNGASASGENR